MKVKPVRVVVLRGLGFSFDDPWESPTGGDPGQSPTTLGSPRRGTGEATTTNAVDAWQEEVPPADPENDVGEEAKKVSEKASTSHDDDGVAAAEDDDSDSGVAD